MAELTNLESKLGEVLGLAQAAADAGRKVKGLAQKEKKRDLVETLNQMVEEARETAKRCNQVAGSMKGKKTAISEEARETKEKASEMLEAYLDESADALDGFEFLTMAEAGEVGHWRVLGELSRKAGASEVTELVEWATPIQERHYQDVSKGSLTLAREEDPDEAA
jgi:methyl-accepting chemotaxis protein